MKRRRVSLLFLIVALLFVAGALGWNLFGDLPTPDALITRSARDTTKIFDRNGRLLYEILDPRAGSRTRVRLSDLPLHLRQAVVAVEDANFYQNPGVDTIGVLRAAWQNISAGEIVAGGSTITQQLARQVLLSPEERDTRRFTRKLREAVLALEITPTYSKDQILEMYLNEVYFGQLAYGIEAAARTYFGKPARDLDLAESALLAGLIQSPSAYNPLVNLDAARARQRIALGLMVKNGLITEAQSVIAQAEPLHFASASPTTTLRAPHFVFYVRNLLEARYGAEHVNAGGLRVITTLDLDLQERAENIVHQRLDELTQRAREGTAPDHNVHNAALVALEPATGEILALVGSANYFDAQIDGAVNVALSERQPGSSIKPITYAAAFARDLTPASIFSDVPTTFRTREQLPYEPQNYDLAWNGPISLRSALATSSNVVAVKVLDHIGIPALIGTAHSLGISTFDDSERFGLALTLGAGEVKLFELTSAYATFANAGQRVAPSAILSVNGERLPKSDPQTTLVTPQIAYLITDILSDNAARIPAFGEESALKLARPAAAKTGTTTDFRDNWTIGYTPDLVVGVWVGNADNRPMVGITGITGAAPIWHDVMEFAHKGKPVRDFHRPDGLIQVQVCATSGLLPTQECPRRRAELFIAGTEPTRYDDTFRAYAIDAATGLLWTESCRGPRIERMFRVLPADAREWGHAQGITEPPGMDCQGIRAQIGGGDAAILQITSPSSNSMFALSSQIPLAAQRIEISARAGTSAPVNQVTLVVDGQPFATVTRPPYRALWQLALGEHTVQVVGVSAQGKPIASEVIVFRVVKENE